MVNFMKIVALCLGAIASISPRCYGASFQNGSFEIGTNQNSDLPGGSTDITGWVVTGSLIAWIGEDGGGNLPSNGSLFVDLNGCVQPESPTCIVQGGIRQTFDTTPGTAYTVAFDLNSNNDPFFGPPVPNSIQVSAGNASQTFTYLASPAGGCSPFNCTTPWETLDFIFLATATQSTLSYASLSPNTAGPEIDNVRLASTPEPASWQLCGLSLLLLLTLVPSTTRGGRS